MATCFKKPKTCSSLGALPRAWFGFKRQRLMTLSPENQRLIASWFKTQRPSSPCSDERRVTNRTAAHKFQALEPFDANNNISHFKGNKIVHFGAILSDPGPRTKI